MLYSICILIIVLISLHIISFLCRYKVDNDKTYLDKEIESIVTDLITTTKDKRFEKIDEICLKTIKL